MKGKKRISLLAVLVCMFALVFALGLMSACGDGSGSVTKETADGATWYYGVSAPAATLGTEGDYYLDTETLASYVKTGTNWRAAEKDETGTWFYGENAPLDTVGTEGDFYLNLKTGALYHKSSAGWGESILTLKGEKGRDGVLWFSGDGNPDASNPLLDDAIKGDFYLNTTDFTVWQLDSTNTWTKLGSIKPDNGVNGKSAYQLYVDQFKADESNTGKEPLSLEAWLASLKGDKGETGERGAKGDEGEKGTTGDKGDKGEPGTDGKSAYELYVEQYKAAHEGSESGVLDEQAWLASLKGDKGDPGEDSVHFFYGEGDPNKKSDLAPVEGDLYVGQFDGTSSDGRGSGSILYRYNGKTWVPIMESMTKGTISIFSLDKLIEFSKLVAAGNTFENTTVCLKTDIDFNDAATISVKARASIMAIAATDWTPIGTEAHPFKGTFDGEGHTISNFTVESSSADAPAGFFGKVDGATIENLHFENATVTATSSSAVAAVVVGESKGDVTLQNVTVSGTVTAADSSAVGSLVGKNNGGTVKAKDVEVSVSGLENTKDNFVGDGDVTMDGDYATGEQVGKGFVKKTEYSSDGSSTGTVYEISSLDGLKTFRDSVNNEKKTYEGETVVLDTDIELKDEKTWTPIGNSSTRFLGNFDGQNHTVSNLKIINNSKSNVYNSGFFGAVGNYTLTQGNSIKNLTIENVEMPAAETPTDENPHGRTDTFSSVGAFIGSAQLVDLENLTLKGDVYIAGKSNIGGIVGEYTLGGSTDAAKHYTATIRNITVDTTGTISASSEKCGAVIGSMPRLLVTSGDAAHSTRTINMSNITIKDVTVMGTKRVGGIIGGGILEKVNITIDGATLTNVKILSAGLTSEVESFGALIGVEERRDGLNSVNTTSTFIFKNISGDVSVAKASEKEQYQAKQLNKGLIGALDTMYPPTVTDDENVTLQITWYGEPVVAE